jgi:alkylation response protein AidB-like acyl-CoA dehydrogenase
VHSILTDEQVLFADAVSRFVDQEYGRGPARPGHTLSRCRLRKLADLGCLSLAIPPDYDGLGGPVEAMIAMESLAPGLPREPVLASGIHAAALLAASAPPERAANLLPRLAAGDLVVAVAHQEEKARYDPDFVEAGARREGNRIVLSGRKSLVPCAPVADLLVVSARDEASGALGLYLVDPRTSGVTVTPRAALDGLSYGDVHLAGCAVSPGDALDAAPAPDALAHATDLAEAAQVAEMVGLMAALVSTTIDYVRTRRQFGVAIGTFQALQHRIADMWMACEETRSLAFAAALACGGPADGRGRAVALAKIRACDAAHLVGGESIQFHGGIGMTDELIVSHWYRRLLALRASLGDRRHYLNRIVAMNGVASS